MVKRVSAIFIMMSVLGFAINAVGIFRYAEISNDHPDLQVDAPRTLSEEAFWYSASRKPEESLNSYIERLSSLVSDRMLRIEPRHTGPTFFENWILWLAARIDGRYEWTYTPRAVRVGGGLCSQHAIVFNNVARSQGIESRIVGLGGHVVNEVLIDTSWQVVDPYYDVVLGASLSELEREPQLVYQAYSNAGISESEARQWANMYSSSDDNYHYRKTHQYAVIPFLFERAALLGIWILPSLLLLLALVLIVFLRVSQQDDSTTKKST